ncbi:hypothetical protein ACVWWR_003005 [Bradyrhizobium sp. LM3.2]
MCCPSPNAPGLTEALNQVQTSAITEQKRPNAINPSPVEGPAEPGPHPQFQYRAAPAPTRPTRVFPSPLPVVLVLARPSAREDGRLNNQFAPIFRPEMSGELEGNAGDDTAKAVSNNRVNEASTAGLW